MTTTMSHGGFRRQDNVPPEFNLREWDLQANRITTRHNNTNSRRFSASNIREDITRLSSFRSNVTVVSSTASSPGYPLIKDEIDPSTYSFTSALKALQVKSGLHNNFECLSPEGFALHSKWNDAERYISNPHSGQVPMECLSARSFRNLQNRTTMSAPLVYNFTQTKIPSLSVRESGFLKNIPIEEKKEAGMTRDIGIQIGTPIGSSSSSSLSPASTPSIHDRAPKRYGMEGTGESSNSSSKPKSADFEVQRKQDNDEEDDESSKNKLESEKEIISCSDSDEDSHSANHRRQQIRRCGPSAGCLSWMVVKKQPLTKPSSIKTKKNLSLFPFRLLKRAS